MYNLNTMNKSRLTYIIILTVMMASLVLIFIGLFLSQNVEYNITFYYQSNVDDIMNHIYYEYNETFSMSYSLFSGTSSIENDLYAWYNNNTLMFIYDNVYLQSYTVTYKIYLSMNDGVGTDQVIIFAPILTSFTKLIDGFSIDDNLFLINKILLFIGMIAFFSSMTFVTVTNLISRNNRKNIINKEKENT